MSRKPLRRHAIRLAAVALATGLAGTIVTTPAQADDRTNDIALTAALQELTRTGIPGVTAAVVRDGRTRSAAAGTADRATGASMPANPHVRIGSATKAFVATLVLQLVAEKRIDLDASIERYLPGVIAGNGNDGRRISVRQTLQHRTGLSDYLGHGSPAGVVREHPAQIYPLDHAARFRSYSPEELLRITTSIPPRAQPGGPVVYTNANYILLGMLLERVTGKRLENLLAERITTPLGLHETYLPVRGDTAIRSPHPRGYHPDGGKLTDVTEVNTSWAWAAGAMVSTPTELNRFFRALFGGVLIPDRLVREMRRQPLPLDRAPEDGYGLGVIRHDLSCGPTWGHGGSLPGFETRVAVLADGTATVLITTAMPTEDAQERAVERALDVATCGAR